MNKSIPPSQTIILITGNGMGRGDAALQQKLIKTYLRLLEESDILPSLICLYTDGVRLVTAGSPVLNELRALEAKGVNLVICGTCLDHYDLREAVEVGIVGGMTDIIEAQFRAEKVITL